MTNGIFCWGCIFRIHKISSGNVPSVEKRCALSFWSAQSWSFYTVRSISEKNSLRSSVSVLMSPLREVVLCLKYVNRHLPL